MLLTLVLAFNWGTPALARSPHEGHGNISASGHATMEHGMMEGTFSHHAEVEGVRAAFEVMSLAAMNMSDPEGNTHHIMVKFFHVKMDHQIANVVGKVKVISPSGKEQVASLKDYGTIFAANFTFKEKGKYGVICLFKVDGQKHLVKFWYPHG
jgi:hypothetical protein